MTVNKYPAEFISDQSHEVLQGWDSLFPIRPKEFHHLVEQGLGVGTKIEMVLAERKAAIRFYLPEAKYIGGVHMVIGLEKISGKTVVKDESIKLPPELQGGGIGKKWFRTKLELAAALGEKDNRFRAGMANGAYSWARMGANLDMQVPSFERQYQSRRMMGRLEGLKEFISSGVFGMARTFSRLTNADDIQRIIEMDVALPLSIRDDLRTREVGGRALGHMREFFEKYPLMGEGADIVAFGELSHVCKAFDVAAMRQHSVTLARCLLAETSYDAVVDFKNSAQMELIQQRIGGWKTMAPS